MDQKGFSLIDIVVSLVIIGMISYVFSASLMTFQLNKKNHRKTSAYQFVNTELGAIKAEPFEQLKNVTEGECDIGAFDYGKKVISLDGLAVTSPNVLKVSPQDTMLSNNVSSIALLPQGSYTDFSLSSYIKILQDSGAGWKAGIVFSYQDTKNYYLYHFKSNLLGITKVSEGIPTSLYSEARSFSKDVWEEFEIIVSGSTVNLHLNDAPVIQLTDQTIDSGYIGFMGFDDTIFAIDNIDLGSSIQNTTWMFDSQTVDAFPQGFLKIFPTFLEYGACDLSISDYLGNLNMKKIEIRFKWQEGGIEKNISVFTIRSPEYGS